MRTLWRVRCVIDLKPFVGDLGYDATQHRFDCAGRLYADPMGLIRRFASLLDVDEERFRLWLFARTTAESRDDWDDEDLVRLARSIAP